jgi:predicted Zn-dependent protease
MLFDLRGRHRRRFVRLLYTGLALLIGLGLVGFGVGGGFGGGGILSSVSENESSSSTSFSAQIKKYRKQTKQRPSDLAAWEGLIKAQLGESSNYTQNGVSSKGKEIFAEAAESWQSYLALNPPHPSTALASQMVLVYGSEGLNQPTQAVAALQILVAARPTSPTLYAELAEYAYKAKDSHTGELAAAKAESLAPAAQKAQYKKALAEVKAAPNGGQTYTTTQNGKTYTGSAPVNGNFSGKEVKTSTTSTTKK